MRKPLPRKSVKIRISEYLKQVFTQTRLVLRKKKRRELLHSLRSGSVHQKKNLKQESSEQKHKPQVRYVEC